MKKLMLFLMLLMSHSLKPGWRDVFWNSSCRLNSEFTPEDLSPRASSNPKDSAPGQETNLFKVLFYTVSCRWCEDIVNAQAYKEPTTDLKQCTSGDDGYVCACAGCTGATACCCLYGCAQCPEIVIPVAMMMGGGCVAHKVREKYLEKYGLKKSE